MHFTHQFPIRTPSSVLASRVVLLALAVFSLSGCVALERTWPKPSAPFYHAATPAQAAARAAEWQAKGRVISFVRHTGSMRPWLQGGETVVLRLYAGEPVRPGQVVSFWGADGTSRTLHLAADVRPGAVYTTGLHNRQSDGWIPAHRIFAILEEVITQPSR